MSDDTISCWNKLKAFLTRKLEERRSIIKNLNRKRTIIKILYYSTTILSIVISAILAAISTSLAITPITITILSITSAILTAISIKFNFKDKSNQLCRKNETINKLNSKLDYVVICNGDLSEDTRKQIQSEFMQ